MSNDFLSRRDFVGGGIAGVAMAGLACAPFALADEAAESAAPTMKPGSYTASSKSGYWQIIDLPVTVTVNEHAILDIKTPADRFEHGETEIILQSVIDRYFPRIIESQSLDVDIVTGATLTCAGARAAIRQALQQALEAAGGDPESVSAFEVPVEKPEAGQTEELTCDLLVVGLGTGGVMAMKSACEAIQERNDHHMVSIIGIDRAGRIGGKSSLTHSAFSINPSHFVEVYNEGQNFVERDHIEELWYQYGTTDGELVLKEEMIGLMLDETGKTTDWLWEHGWLYGTPAPGGFTNTTGGIAEFNSVITARADTGTYEDRRGVVVKMLQSMASQVESQGGKIMLETEAYALLGDGGKVTGVKARDLHTGKEYVINAKAIIMNTGGYSSNREMMSKYQQPKYSGEYRPLGTGCDTGLMLQAAIDLGAGTYNMGMSPIVMHCGISRWLTEYPFEFDEGVLNQRTGRPQCYSLNNIPLGCAFSGTALAVDSDGQRFMDEATYASFTTDATVDSFPHWAAGACYYVILGEEQMGRIAENGFDAVSTWDGYNTQGRVKEGPVPEVYEGMDYSVEAGIAWKADTIADLATQIEIDPSALEATVAAYNSDCEAGVDSQFAKDPACMIPVATAPFYAVKVINTTFGTIGGLDVDAQMRVLADDHVTPIGGLYAIGLDSMGVIHNPNHQYCAFGGIAQSWLQTGGRISGAAAVDYIEQNGGIAQVGAALVDLPSTY